MSIVTVKEIKYYINQPNDYIQRYLLNGTQWNSNIIDIIKELQYVYNLKHLLNIGAHIGTTCLPLANIFDKITAVEAYPKTFNHLKMNIELNNFRNIDILNIALGDSNEPVKFMDENKVCPREGYNRIANNSGGMHVFREKDIQLGTRSSNLASNQITVDCYKLDDTEIEQFDMVVIDVEGLEAEIIEGGKTKFQQYRPIIICEIWNDVKRQSEQMTTTTQQVISQILALDYQLVMRFDDDYVFHPIKEY